MPIVTNGERFHRLTVLSRAEGRESRFYEFICDCGIRTVKSIYDVRRGYTKSCGCLHRETSAVNGATPRTKQVVDMLGQRFGRLAVVSRAGANKHGTATWLCRCDCGAEKVISANHLRMGNTASCGCAYRERAAVRPAARRAWSNAYVKGRARSDPRYALNRRMIQLLHATMRARNGKKSGRWEELVGYTIEQLAAHLRTTMPVGFSWQDFMDGKLHIDHRTPLAAFNFETATDLDFRRAWALDNLQLLPEPDNLAKADKLDGPFQPSLCF
jgi:5-methylcytosine-specific restriction endonuclease McrA